METVLVCAEEYDRIVQTMDQATKIFDDNPDQSSWKAAIGAWRSSLQSKAAIMRGCAAVQFAPAVAPALAPALAPAFPQAFVDLASESPTALPTPDHLFDADAVGWLDTLRDWEEEGPRALSFEAL